MKRSRHIHNLASLEKEILRLQLRASQLERGLGSNYRYFRKHYLSLLLGSLFFKRRHDDGAGFFEASLRNMTNNEVVREILQEIGNRLSEWLKRLFERIMQKKGSNAEN